MKKIVFIMLPLLAALLCACSSDDGAGSKSETLKDKTPVVQPEDVHANGASALAPQDVVPPASDETTVLAGKGLAANEATPPAAPAPASGETPQAPAAVSAPQAAPPAAPRAENAQAAPAAASPAAVAPSAIAEARQLILAAAPDWKASRAGLARYERAAAGQPWKRVGEAEACMLGRNGLGWGKGLLAETGKGPQKREGDGKTPAGVFSLPGAFGSETPAEATASGVKLPFTQITPDVVCVTAQDSAYFNTLAAKDKTGGAKFDRMSRDSGVNALGTVIGHNMTDPEPKAGSCVFLNILEGPGKATGGSIACPAPALKEILSWLDPKAAPVLVVLPQKEYERLRPVLDLP